MTEATQPKFSPGDIVTIKLTGVKVMVLGENTSLHFLGYYAEPVTKEKERRYYCRLQDLSEKTFSSFELENPPYPIERGYERI